MPPVAHHVELCVGDGSKALQSLERFGFYLHARRTTPTCHQWVAKVGSVTFVITERRSSRHSLPLHRQQDIRKEDWTVLCCEDEHAHHVDTVFNVALRVKNVQAVSKRIVENGGSMIRPPVQLRDQFGRVTYSVVRSCCGNVVHTLINKDDYRGWFLPGFDAVRISGDCDDLDDWDNRVTHVDHVTLACHPGQSQGVISWYENCFGMRRFSINRDDDEDEGLVLESGVGLRLKAMEYWRCAETGLVYPHAPGEKQATPNSVMLVVVESLPGQVNCNVETFLREHGGPGVEHIALSTPSIIDTVTKMATRGVNFRQPPVAYYRQINKVQQIQEIGMDPEALRPLGILLDSEVDHEDDVNPGRSKTPKYLMQIFSHPIFTRKTFFMEVIERCGARGLGAGNILALVRSIREEEEAKKKQLAKLS